MIKRLALVIPSIGPGGMERVMAELAHYFCRQPDLEVHLVLYGKTREIFYSVPDNITVHTPHFKFNDNMKLWSTIKTILFIRRIVSSIKPNSVLSFGEYWNSLVLLSLYGMKYPVFISDRCQPDKKYGKIHDILRRFFYPGAKGIITQTQKAESIYRLLFKYSNIQTIGNPIHFIDTNTDIKKENIVLSVGRLIETKHHDQLIRTFIKINKPGWKLVIVGADALKQKNFSYLKELINELDANDRVILMGNRLDVDKFYLSSKIFAFTSSSEGFPNVIGEAMSAGLPVVSFDCMAGPSDMVIDGISGYLVPLFNYDLFSKKLELLIDNYQLCKDFGKNGKEYINKYSPELIGEKFQNFII